jgi:hypothetical protein
MASKQRRGEPRPALLAEDNSPIKLVPDADRAWWNQLSQPARARFAERRGKRWTDEETMLLIEADPDEDDYYSLGAKLGRSPGALRIRRAHMVHLLRDEYGYAEKAAAYAGDPKRHHRHADIAHVSRLLHENGYFDLPVSEQFRLARHLKQPSDSWRGDRTGEVLRGRKRALLELERKISSGGEERGSAAGASDRP